MKKFYKIAEYGTAPGGYVVRLDGKPVKTPLKHVLLMKAEALARAVAAEWQAQGEEIIPASMPLTQLASTMLDKAAVDDRAGMNRELCEYSGSDLICYFAIHPTPLVRRHEAQWRPLLAWMQERHGIALEAVSGIQYKQQPPEVLAALRKLIEGLSPADFTVFQAAAGVTGSVVIGLALLDGRLSPEEAWQAACVDEVYQLETWGEDAEARKRLDTILSELKTAVEFRDLVRSSA